jgi:serine/threonine protein kinase
MAGGPPTLASGTRIGPYVVESLLGRGGMGEVYRATDTNLRRAVAVKVLPGSVAGDESRLERFRREAQVLAALDHPGIARVHGLETANGVTAIVMELVAGEGPDERIARGALPVAEVLRLARAIADALAAAHERGIVHRDLKPENVKLPTDGGARVLDFGLAKLDQSGVMPVGSQAPAFPSPPLMLACVPARCYAVAPDGQRFYGTQMMPLPPSPPVTHIHLILNWTEELRARVPGGPGGATTSQ